MKYIRRRQIPQLVSAGANEERLEIYGGKPVKYLVIEGSAATAEFAVEVNGVPIIDCTINTLARENGIRYGFDGVGGDNATLAILSFEDEHLTDIVNTNSIRQLTFVKKSDHNFDITVVEELNY